MGLKKSTKDRIKTYILEKISNGDSSFVSKAASNFDVSLTSVYRYVKELARDGFIKQEGKKYSLKDKKECKLYDMREKLEEDRIFEELVKSAVNELPDNVRRIWQYAFTEMVNNAIDHSEASELYVSITSNCLSTTAIIDDNGIGIFSKIKTHYGYETLDDAVHELFKGKLTTDSERHTGEGIFFTSRMIENFAVLSGGKIFTHNTHFDELEDIEQIPQLRQWKDRKGTVVIMSMPNNSKVNIKEVFDMFSGADNGFNKTQIPLKSIFTDGFPVSRSQAKRLSMRFEDFEEIILDFDGVEDIGQGFAHELFVVIRRNHPNIKFTVINENSDVKKMISHVSVKEN